ncbi:Predicted RNA methylase [Tistlia consotensis]|uniref:Predicted RNA methylase n=1 Tax=Tistlia consotensis USBA 355 TaxID=560819 RepID=A0A1Y6C9X4_9PROT|nr:tetratricopeptide repeat protein [Tistlia consotensis]SMF44165.1 Predicted RNA methylase [Tistlia consotensis USBA 355]SNR43130.1 Predicted RNA methylase [Tistlia consotensis]
MSETGGSETGASEAAASLSDGWARLAEGRLGEARLVGLKVLAAEPDNAGAKHLLGLLAAHEGDAASARLLLDEAAAAGGGARIMNDLGSVDFGQQRYDAAAASFERAIEAEPGFADAIGNLGSVRLMQGRLAEARELFHRALDLRPGHVPLLKALGRVEAQRGDYAAALRALARASAAAPDDPQIERAVAEVAGLHRMAWHFPMMNDARRNRAFREAIERTVRPGDLVLEIGTGSGLLAMMAARAGAERVVTLELVPQLAALAREVIARNGLADRVEVLPVSSRAATVGEQLPRPADVLISEVLDANLLGEDVLGTVADAQQRLLAPGARVLPARARLLGRPVESERMERFLSVGEIEGFDLSPFGRMAMAPLMRFDTTGLGNRPLGPAFEVLEIDLTRPLPLDGRASLEARVEAPGRLDALVLWIEIEVAEGIVYSADPSGPWTSWHQAVQPVEGRPRVEAGQRLRIEVEWQRRFVFLGTTVEG